MVAASAKAAMKPNAGCTGSNAFAPMNSANVAASTSVASSFDAPQLGGARGVAGRVDDEGGGKGHDGFRMDNDPHPADAAQLRVIAERCEASEALMDRDGRNVAALLAMTDAQH